MYGSSTGLWHEELETGWQDAEQKLVDALPIGMRALARTLLENPRLGGRGLRSLVLMLVGQNRALPDSLPPEWVEVYLKDDDAEPLHDCGECGLPIPVRVGRRCGHEPTTERVYFPQCPHCGGKTGRYAYWSGPRVTLASARAVAHN